MICAEERLTFVGEDDIEIEMRVPQEAVKLIIGRQGANIKQVSVQASSWLSQRLILLNLAFLLCPHPTLYMSLKEKIQELLVNYALFLLERSTSP